MLSKSCLKCPLWNVGTKGWGLRFRRRLSKKQCNLTITFSQISLAHPIENLLTANKKQYVLSSYLLSISIPNLSNNRFLLSGYPIEYSQKSFNQAKNPIVEIFLVRNLLKKNCDRNQKIVGEAMDPPCYVKTKPESFLDTAQRTKRRYLTKKVPKILN